MTFYSPLRYPGGKRKLSSFIKLVIKENALLDGYYIEPYAGGASVALSLLCNEYVSNVVINDIDRSIYSFWKSVLNHTDELCNRIINARLSMKEWERNKEIQRNKKKASVLDLGFSTFYLNRTNMSGIINGGVIGGKSQKGKWGIDARFNKKELVKRIQTIVQYKDRIKLYNLDAIKLVKKICKQLPSKTLFYFDPPYYLKGSTLYVNHYKREDHVNVARVIKSLKHRWVVSYDEVDEIKELYKSYEQLIFSLNYNATKVKKGKELIFISRKLNIPQVENPVKVI